MKYTRRQVALYTVSPSYSSEMEDALKEYLTTGDLDLVNLRVLGTQIKQDLMMDA